MKELTFDDLWEEPQPADEKNPRSTITDYHIPIVMLVTGIGFQPDGQAEMFGFWYFAEMELPPAKKGGGVFLGDMVREQSCQLIVRGTVEQITEILRSSDFEDTEDLLQAAKQGVGSYIELDDINDPQGTSAGVDVMVKMTEENSTAFRKLSSRRDTVELQIAPGWSWADDMRAYPQS